VFTRNALSLALFSSVAWKGRGGSSGASLLTGQPQSATMPEKLLGLMQGSSTTVSAAEPWTPVTKPCRARYAWEMCTDGAHVHQGVPAHKFIR
jgi:hypothetical protein